MHLIGLQFMVDFLQLGRALVEQLVYQLVLALILSTQFLLTAKTPLSLLLEQFLRSTLPLR